MVMILWVLVRAGATHGLRPGDVNCREFMFMTREEFERDIEQDRFLEYGEVRGHFYGTAFSTIKQLMESGHVPVLDVHPQVRDGKKGNGCGTSSLSSFTEYSMGH